MDLNEKIEFFRTHLNSATFKDVTFSARVSKFVPEDQVFMFKQNDYRIWVISGRTLTPEEFIGAINLYEERQAHPK